VPPHPTGIPKTYDQKNAMKKRHNDKTVRRFAVRRVIVIHEPPNPQQCQIDQKETHTFTHTNR